jgi:hypothetical protein
MEGVISYINLEAVTGGEGLFVVDYSPECSNELSKVRKAFWIEFEQSKEVGFACGIVIALLHTAL